MLGPVRCLKRRTKTDGNVAFIGGNRLAVSRLPVTRVILLARDDLWDLVSPGVFFCYYYGTAAQVFLFVEISELSLLLLYNYCMYCTLAC